MMPKIEKAGCRAITGQFLAASLSKHPYAQKFHAGCVKKTRAFLSKNRLNVEFEQQDVTVFDHVFFAFHPIKALFARDRHRTPPDQVVVGHGFGFYKTALEIAVDDPGCLGGGIAGMDGPSPHFLFPGGEVGPEAEQVVSTTDKRPYPGLFHTQLF
jgi:hypothetical protein